jgi:hypothetical protein
MEKRHENDLMAMLEEVQYRGWAHVETWRVYLWYNIDKIRKEPYRDLKRRWSELAGSKQHLYVSWTESGLLLVGSQVKEIAEMAE